MHHKVTEFTCFFTPFVKLQVNSCVSAGEWYRLITCTMLHGGPLHLLMNCQVPSAPHQLRRTLMTIPWDSTLVGVTGDKLCNAQILPTVLLLRVAEDIS